MTADQVMAYAKEKYTIILEKVLQHNKILDNYLKTLSTFDEKLSTLIEMCSQKGLFTSEEFEALHDHNTGWRKKGPQERVSNGDVVWVDYTLTSSEIKEKVPAGFVEEKGLPVRMGAKAIIFEESIVDRLVGETYEHTHKDDKDEFHFTITVQKIKSPLEGAFDGANTEARNGSDGVEATSSVENNV